MSGDAGQGLRDHAMATMERFPLSDSAWESLRGSLDLSKRELEVVRAIFDGGCETSIAQDLNVSCHTVHSHLDRLYKKLRVNSRCALAVRVFAEYLALYPPYDSR